MTTILHNGRRASETRSDFWLAIGPDGKIADMGYGYAPCPDGSVCHDLKGALVLPGVIDCHVHLREPGLTAKADIESESRALLAGGVTSYIDMPNTVPQTTTIAAWQQKCDIAGQRSWGNYAFFIGAAADNAAELAAADYSRVPGIKLFMGSSTGNMLVDDDDRLNELFAAGKAIIAVHAEDQAMVSAAAAKARAEHPEGVPVEMHSLIRSAQACYQCSARAAELARRHGRRLHICHLSTARELELLGGPVTAEVSPHHLLWCVDDYAALGTRIKMNPAVKTAADRQALRQALSSGLVPMIATDHAPHLPADKQGDALNAASGAPIAQFSLPLMLSIFDEATVERAMCAAPAEIYGIQGRGRIEPGFYADLAIVRTTEPYAITDDMVLSRCGWTPAIGRTVSHRVEQAWVNGSLAFDSGAFLNRPPVMPLSFSHN